MSMLILKYFQCNTSLLHVLFICTRQKQKKKEKGVFRGVAVFLAERFMCVFESVRPVQRCVYKSQSGSVCLAGPVFPVV